VLPLFTWQWGKGVPLQHWVPVQIQQPLLQPCGGGKRVEGKARQCQQSAETGKAGATNS